MYFLDLVLTGLIFTAPILIYRFAMKKDKVEKKKAFGLAFLCGICGYIVCSFITIGIYGQVANPSTLGIWTVIDWLILGDFKKKENASTHEEKDPSPPTKTQKAPSPPTKTQKDRISLHKIKKNETQFYFLPPLAPFQRRKNPLDQLQFNVADWLPATSYASDEEATLNEEASTQDAEGTELVTQITSFEYTDDC